MKRWVMRLSLLAFIISVGPRVTAQEFEYLGSTPWASINDVKVSGDYAYCASVRGLIVLNVSDPANPVLVSQLWLPDGNKLFFDADRLYLARGDSGLDIINASDQANPYVMAHSSAPPHAHDVFTGGNYAYIADDSLGLLIMDVSDPTNPVARGNLSTPGYAQGIFKAGNYAYIADGGFYGLQVINVENPYIPVRAVDYRDSLHMPTNVYVENNYAFIANFPSDFVILDVSNPSQPRHVSRAWWPIHSNDVVPSGNYAYSACQEFGLEVYDISNPRTPTLIGSSDSLGFLLNLDISAEYAYLTCIQHGLYIIDISQPSAPEITGNYHVSNVYNLVETAGSYAFVADTTGGFAAIDISDPAAPNVAARFDTAYTGRIIFMEGNTLYSLSEHLYSRALRIYDITNPANPVVAGSYPTSFYAGTLADGYFYVTGRNPSLEIIDVHDPAHPTLAGSYDIGDTVVNNVEVAGNYAYLIGGWTRHRILDISDRSNPALIGFFTTSFMVNNLNVSGNFMYLGIALDSVLVLDISNPVTPVQVNAIHLTGPSGARRGVKIIDNRLITYSRTAAMEIFDLSDPASPVLIDSLPLYGRDFALRNEYLYEADREFITWRLNLTGMEDNPGRIPSVFSISQNYPNPFNAQTTISYDLPASAIVTVEIFNILGEKLETLVNEYQLVGSHQIIWNASKAASGVYLCRIKAGASMATEKMLLIK